MGKICNCLVDKELRLLLGQSIGLGIVSDFLKDTDAWLITQKPNVVHSYFNGFSKKTQFFQFF